MSRILLIIQMRWNKVSLHKVMREKLLEKVTMMILMLLKMSSKIVIEPLKIMHVKKYIFQKLRNVFLDHRNRESLSNSSQQNFVVFHEQQRQPNRASLTESASPSSGVIKNKTSEKEKVIEVKESHSIAQEQHHYHHEVIHHEHHEHNDPNEHHDHYDHHKEDEHHESSHAKENHEIIHHEPSYVEEKEIHKEEEPLHHQPEKTRNIFLKINNLRI